MHHDRLRLGHSKSQNRVETPDSSVSNGSDESEEFIGSDVEMPNLSPKSKVIEPYCSPKAKSTECYSSFRETSEITI